MKTAQADAAADSGASAAEARQDPSTAERTGADPDKPQHSEPESPPFVQRPTILDELLESDEVLQESEIEKRLLMINKRMPKCALKLAPASANLFGTVRMIRMLFTPWMLTER